MSDKKRLTAKVEKGQNQVGIVNFELQPMIIRVTDEDGEPASYVRVDIHRMDEGQGHFELVDQMTDQTGCAAALYVPAELTTRYEIEFRVINGDDSSAAVLFTGCVADPCHDVAVELPVSVGLRRTGRSIHPRADVPQLNPMIAPRAEATPLNDSWFSNEASLPAKEAPAPPETPAVVATQAETQDTVLPPPPPMPVISAVLAAPVVPSTVARKPPRPRPVPEAVTIAKAAVAHRHYKPRVVALPQRKRDLPLRYLIAAAVVMWVLVGAGFLVLIVSKPISFKSGRTTVTRPDNAAETAQTYALGDTVTDSR